MDLPSHTSLERIDPSEELREKAARFYREIVLPPTEPFEIPEGIEPVDAFVTDTTTLEINNTPILLRGHQLFIANALLERRHKPSTTVRDGINLGFAPNNTNDHARAANWATNINYLTKKVNSAAEQEIILRSGIQPSRYNLYPGLRVHEQRGESQKPESWYEFAQVIRSGVIRLPYPTTLHAADDQSDPVRIFIRDDNTLVTNSEATIYNPHELSLLNLLLLHHGEPLTYAQIWALGFHAYAPNESAKLLATYRAVHRLSALLSDASGKPALTTESATAKSSVRISRNLHFIDLRDHTILPDYSEMAPVFAALLEASPLAHETRHIVTLPPAEAEDIMSRHASDALTQLEMYKLSLLYGVMLPQLHGTELQRRTKLKLNYNEDIYPHINPGKPSSRTVVGRIFDVGKSSIYHSEYMALQKLRNAKGKSILNASKILGQTTPEARQQAFLEAAPLRSLASYLGWQRTTTMAVILHLTPDSLPGGRKPGLEAGLQDLRIFANAAQRATENSNRYNHINMAAAALLKMTGTTEPGISFVEFAEADSFFAQHGEQMVADILALFTAYLLASPKSQATPASLYFHRLQPRPAPDWRP